MNTKRIAFFSSLPQKNIFQNYFFFDKIRWFFSSYFHIFFIFFFYTFQVFKFFLWFFLMFFCCFFLQFSIFFSSFFLLLKFLIFFVAFLHFLNFLKVTIRLLLKVTDVTTNHQKWPKVWAKILKRNINVKFSQVL